MNRRKFFIYTILFTAGCTTGTGKLYENKEEYPLGVKPEKLRFAVTDVRGLEKLQQDYEAFRAALEQILEVKIEFLPMENFIAATPALLNGQVDLVLAGPSEYVILNARAKAVPLVALTRPGYYSVIAVRGDSNIKSLTQLKNKIIAMRTEGSTAGHLGAVKMLMDAGLQPKYDYKVVMLGDRGMEALKEGEVDACGISSFYYDNFLKQEGVSEREFPKLATGNQLPSDVFVVSSQLNSDFVLQMRSRIIQHQEKLIQALTSSSKFFFERFHEANLVSASDADYEVIRSVYQAIGEGELIR